LIELVVQMMYYFTANKRFIYHLVMFES
jgi:hypothetical protein